MNQKPCFVKPLTPNSSFFFLQEVHQATHQAVFCSSEWSRQVAWQEAPGFRGFLGHSGHNFPFPKQWAWSPILCYSSAAQGHGGRARQPCRSRHEMDAQGFRSPLELSITWVAEAWSCRAVENTAQPANLQAWVQLHFKTITKLFHYICFAHFFAWF